MTDRFYTWWPWRRPVVGNVACQSTSFCKRPGVKTTRGEDGCVTIDEKNFLEVAMGGSYNVLVIFYTRDVQNHLHFADSLESST
jgi:hypothetical protein